MDSLPHTHDEYNIVFCLTPGLSYSLRGRLESLATGDVLVINPEEPHRGHYGSEGIDARGLTLHIPVRVLKEILAKMRFLGDLGRNRVLFLDKMEDRSLMPWWRSWSARSISGRVGTKWSWTLSFCRFWCICSEAFVPSRLNAQAVGSIVGQVTDPGKAVVPGATVTAVEKGTNFTRTITTSSSGDYSLPRLPVGTYMVTAEASGFEKSSVDVTLDVEQKREVNFTLVLKARCSRGWDRIARQATAKGSLSSRRATNPTRRTPSCLTGPRG